MPQTFASLWSEWLRAIEDNWKNSGRPPNITFIFVIRRYIRKFLTRKHNFQCYKKNVENILLRPGGIYKFANGKNQRNLTKLKKKATMFDAGQVLDAHWVTNKTTLKLSTFHESNLIVISFIWLSFLSFKPRHIYHVDPINGKVYFILHHICASWFCRKFK